MRRFVTIAGGWAAATLAAITAATTVAAQPVPDPMAAVREAPPYDALHPAGAPPLAELPAAVPDPMAAAGQPQLTTATQAAEHGIQTPNSVTCPMALVPKKLITSAWLAIRPRSSASKELPMLAGTTCGSGWSKLKVWSSRTRKPRSSYLAILNRISRRSAEHLLQQIYSDGAVQT